MKKSITLFLLGCYVLMPLVSSAQNACCGDDINNQAPVLNCNNISITCNQRLENLRKPAVSDDCTLTEEIELSYVDDKSNVNPCGQGGFILRTWTATDACGLTATCVQTISIINNGLVNNCQLGLTNFRCEKDTDIRAQLVEWNRANIDFLMRCAMFGCDNPVTVTSTFDVNSIGEDCETTSEQFVSYTIEDACGRTVFKFGKYTIQKLFDPICDTLEIQSTDNQIVINNLMAPNNIIKIYDEDYALAYECIGDCGSSITVPILNTGETYYTDVQAYDENWVFICEDKQEIVVDGGNEPCDTSICQGDVFLSNQAEIDAFCGCEVIEGDLVIGNSGGGNFAETDIVNLESLSSLKMVGGALVFGRTQLINFKGLENISSVNNVLTAVFNSKLETYEGLESLEDIGGLIAIQNPELKNFGENNNLKTISGQIYLEENARLNSLQALSEITEISGFEMVGCPSIKNLDGFNQLIKSRGTINVRKSDQLESLSGLENLKTIGTALVIVDNPNLASISALSNLTTAEHAITILRNNALNSLEGLANVELTDVLNIQDNPSLTACCSISHLLDDNLNNGRVTGNILIANNPQFCNSVEEILQNCEEPLSSCESIQINIENNEIILTGLTAPNEIVKVFDQDYQILYQCVADCEDTQSAGTFPEGSYIVDIQLYDENWINICAEQRTVTVQGMISPPTDCDDISLVSESNELIINILNTPNSIVKVFDNDWQLVFQCQNDCDATLEFNNLQIGDVYHLDAQFYDKNWQLICAKKADKRIGSDTQPCPDPICLGNIEFNTQAEIDEFCGCERIEGQLTIGQTGEVSDITDLSNLSDLKEIGGSLVVQKTRLTDLEGLNNLEKAVGINMFSNPDLWSLNGLDRLQALEFGIFLINAPILTDISALGTLKSLRSLRLDNVGMKDLTAFNNIENTTIDNLFLLNCDRLESLDGFQWTRIAGGPNPGTLNITNNESLTDVTALENVEFISGALIIRDNNRLTDCCPITHLIDDDTENGQVVQTIIIERNPINCGNIATVLEVCEELDPNENCDALQISTTANQLKISNILSPNSTIKVYDQAYQLAFQCSGDCGEEVVVDLSNNETYNLDIQLFDGSWQSLCNLLETVTIGAQDRSNDLQAVDFSLSPNPARNEVLINLKPLVGEKVTLQLQNQFGQVVLTKAVENATELPEKMDLSAIANGLYFLQIQSKGRRAVGKKILVSKLY